MRTPKLRIKIFTSNISKFDHEKLAVHTSKLRVQIFTLNISKSDQEKLAVFKPKLMFIYSLQIFPNLTKKN